MTAKACEASYPLPRFVLPESVGVEPRRDRELYSRGVHTLPSKLVTCPVRVG